MAVSKAIGEAAEAASAAEMAASLATAEAAKAELDKEVAALKTRVAALTDELAAARVRRLHPSGFTACARGGCARPARPTPERGAPPCLDARRRAPTLAS